MAFTQRSEGSRTAVLTAARELLVERGYQGTTIRAVAARAGIDPSMVMRYYGNKEGLFIAAVDVDLAIPIPANHSGQHLGEALARHFVDRWEGSHSDELITLLLRSAGTSPTAAAQMRTVFAQQVQTFVTAVVGDDPRAADRAVMLCTQVLGVALCRYVLELPPLATMGADDLVAMLAPVLQHYLTGDLPAAV